MSSKHLTQRQLHALERVGDLLLPGFDDLPCFSSLHCVSRVDRVLDYMPERDVSDLKLLLTLLSFCPAFLINGFIHVLEWSPSIPTPVGALLRLVHLGLRGLAMSLYYSDPRIETIIGYDVRVYRDDQK